MPEKVDHKFHPEIIISSIHGLTSTLYVKVCLSIQKKNNSVRVSTANKWPIIIAEYVLETCIQFVRPSKMNSYLFKHLNLSAFKTS